MRMVRQVPRSGSGKRREQGGCGAEGQHHRVPAMGRERARQSAEVGEREWVPRMGKDDLEG
jgi:hypothetical protein